MNFPNIIGRGTEISTLDRLYKSRKSEFLAIYGRRRVGKSYLISEVYKRKIAFSAVGTYVKDGDKNEESYRKLQLRHFYDSLLYYGMTSEAPVPKDWREAFTLLRQLLEKSTKRRKVIVLDELPWLAGPQSSELVSELGFFWNFWADSQRNIVLVVCGSATSWMLDNVIHDYGGLHGRLSEIIHLQPFTLSECECYYKKHGFHLSQYEIALSYMAIGGIPYYLDKFRCDQTITDNIDRFFYADENIHQEFKDVYAGLYTSKDKYIDIVKAIGSQFYGMTQSEIQNKTGITGGGTFSKMLENLRECGIIREYPRYGGERVETIYQLIDFFTLFYLRFIDGCNCKAGGWRSIQRTGTFYNWAGETFELLCIAHLPGLQEALRIVSVDRNYCWSGKGPDGRKAQIDLLIESDPVRTDYLCEMKFSEGKYPLTQKDVDELTNKIAAYNASKMHKNSHSIQVIMVTAMGLYASEHHSIITKEATLKDLFH